MILLYFFCKTLCFLMIELRRRLGCFFWFSFQVMLLFDSLRNLLEYCLIGMVVSSFAY